MIADSLERIEERLVSALASAPMRLTWTGYVVLWRIALTSESRAALWCASLFLIGVHMMLVAALDIGLALGSLWVTR